MAYGTSQAYTSADRYMPPKGFVFSFQGGDYYNPTTGERWSPVTGQVYGEVQPSANTVASADATTTQSQPSLGQQGLSLGANTLATTGTMYGVNSLMGGAGGTAPSMPVIIPELSGEAAAAGGTAEATAGATTAGSSSMAAAPPVLAAFLTDYFVKEHGNERFNQANAFLNPAGTITTNIGSIKPITSGEELSTEQNLALTGGPAGIYGSAGRSLLNPLIYASLFQEGRGIFGSSKGKEHMQRDVIRQGMKDMGILPKDNKYVFSDGTVFDFGLDGGAELQNVGRSELQPGGTRRYFQIDWTDPNAAYVVGGINPILDSLQFGDDEARRADIGGYYYNATVAGNPKDIDARLREVYSYVYGPQNTRDNAATSVWNAYNNGQITPEQRNADLAAIDKIFGVVNPNQGKGGEAEFGRAYIPQNSSPTQSASLRPLSTQPNPTPPLSPSPNVQQTIPQGTTVPDRAKGRLATPAGFSYFGNPAQVAPAIGSRVAPTPTLGRSIGLGAINKIAEQARPAIRAQAKTQAASLARAIAGKIGAKK